MFIQSLVERKKKSQEDVARLEAEMAELRISHDVSFLFLDQKISLNNSQ